MPGKPITPEGLARDLQYVLGTVYHEAFYEVCPPRVGVRVLEPGCGSGKFGLAYWLHGADVTLLDIDPGVLAYTRALWARVSLMQPEPVPNWVEILEGSIHDLSTRWPQPTFDYVLNEGIPHHWPREDPRRQGAIDQMAAVTKPGGKVALMVSNAHCPEMQQYARTIQHTYAGMPETQVPFSQDELLEALARAGLKDIGVRPVESIMLAHARTLLGYGTKG